MQRRAFLQRLVALVPAAAGVTSLLALSRQAFALGGSLPPLDQPAPAFELPGIAPAADGQALATRLGLADFAGQWLVLYFYPRDFTGGCTLEARGFQKDLAAYTAANAVVVGVSADDAESHADFCSSEGLAFPLLSDPAGTVSRAYGSWIAPFSQRHTFLIDPEGVLRANWTAVRPSGHSAEVLTTLRELQASR
ncbi:MAG: peroxiredoxin [Cyanobacteriota bacterium]|nr:peroxiredoxin [Cyanobacteriota bacterium]